MNRLKKISAALLALTLVISLGLTAFAKSYEIKEVELTLEIPDDTYIFTSATQDSDESWQEAGLNPVEHKTNYEQLGTLAHFSANGGKTNVYVGKKESDKTKAYFSLKSLTEEQLSEFLSQYNTDEENGMASKAEIYSHPQTPFLKVNITSKPVTQDSKEIFELVYFTIINGYTVSFSHHSNIKIDKASEAYVKALVDSINFLNIQEKAALDPAAMGQALLTLGLLVGFVLLVIAFFVISRIRARRRREATRRLADRISVYRRERTQIDMGERQSLFENSTEHTDASIKIFSRFQVYIRKPYMALSSIAISVFGTALGIWSNAEWWMTLLMAAAAIFCTFKFVTAGSATEKSLKKVYNKMKSRTAKYTFFQNEFLISGIQSAEFYPYFQITDIKEYKDFYYIYFGENNTYFLNKASFTKGSEQEFKSFIKSKTGKKQ